MSLNLKSTLKFTHERVILCEGSSDKAVLSKLIEIRSLSGIQVYFPHGANDETGGMSKFGQSLLGNTVANTNFGVVTSVLLIADKDDDSARNFSDIQSQLSQNGFGVPDKELTFVKSPGKLPMVGVMMIPIDDTVGNLETLCMPAIDEQYSALVPTFNDYYSASNAVNWSKQGNKAKMKIQCLLAASIEKNPYSTLSTLFTRNKEFHFSLNHECFDSIAKFLEEWDTKLPT
jgi:hypothetical protein